MKKLIKLWTETRFKWILIKSIDKESQLDGDIVIKTDHYLSIYWNHITDQEVIESFLRIEKDSYNTIELYNIGLASDDNLNTLSNILKNVTKIDSKKFRNILIYGLERDSKMIADISSIKGLLSLINTIQKLELFAIYIIDLKISNNVLLKIINLSKIYDGIYFLNCSVIYDEEIYFEEYEDFKIKFLLTFAEWYFDYNGLSLTEESKQCYKDLDNILKNHKVWSHHYENIKLRNSFGIEFGTFDLIMEKKLENMSYCFDYNRYCKENFRTIFSDISKPISEVSN